MSFLVFQLWAPMVSWGDIAVGERRLTSPNPSKSAILGIIAASLGIRRDDDEAWSRLSEDYLVATRVDHEGTLLVDYHTVQTTPQAALKKKQIHSRRDELLAAPDKVQTILSYREYLSDQQALACVWSSETHPRWTLQDLSDALKQPVFSPYLGRKACPPGLPFHPQVVGASNPVEALQKASLDPIVNGEKSPPYRTFYWEHFPELPTDQILSRRDQSTRRSRWLFADRQERVWTERMEQT